MAVMRSLVVALVVAVAVVAGGKSKRVPLQEMSYEQLHGCFPTTWSNGAWYDSHFPPAGKDSDGGSLAMKRKIYNTPTKKYAPSNTCALRLSWALSQCRVDKWQSKYTSKSLINGARRPARCWDAEDLAHATDDNARKCEGQIIGRVSALSKWMSRYARVKMTRYDKGTKDSQYSLVCADESNSDTCEPAATSAAGKALLGMRGIIVFEDCGWKDATGHYDLWNGWTKRCEGHCQWQACSRVRVFPMPSVAKEAAESMAKKLDGVKDWLGWQFDEQAAASIDDADADNVDDDEYAQSAALDGSLLV